MKTKNFLLIILFFTCKYLFSQGRVGINTNDPQNVLDINGDVRVRTVNNYNDLTTVVVLDSHNVLSKINIKDSFQSKLLSFQYGESINVGDAVSIGDGITGYNTTSQSLNSLNVSIDSGTYVAQSFVTTSSATGVRAIAFYSTSGQTNFTASIRNTSGGIPLSVDLGVTNYYQAGASIGEFTLIFDPPVPVNPNTQYVFILRFTRPGVNVRFYYDSTNPYTSGTFLQSFDGSTWSNRVVDDLYFKIYETQTIPGRVYKSKIDNSVLSPWATSFFTATPNTFNSGEKYENFLGIAQESGLKDEFKKVCVGNICDNFSGIIGRMYYLSTIPGLLNTTPASLSKRAGLALDGNRIYITK